MTPTLRNQLIHLSINEQLSPKLRKAIRKEVDGPNPLEHGEVE